MAEQAETTTSGRPRNSAAAFLSMLKTWPLPRKIALAAVAALSIALFAFIIIQARTVDYQLLYGSLAESDASAMLDWLKGQNIPYQLANNGHNILIPAKDVYEARLALASAGLPQGGGTGFEIFDKQSFALTDFAQKVNYARALQGELSRTIASLGPVETARVHLALPERRLFKDQQKAATASITLKLVPGKRLNESQIEGIVHLVASSVEGLDPADVTVVDQNGNVLTQVGGKRAIGQLSPDMLEYQAQVEQRLEGRAQALLDKSLGEDRSMVRVTASLDFSQTEKTEETFDPEEPVVRNEQLTEERTGADITGGVPGVQSNLEGNTNQISGATAPSSKTQRTTNYEISKVVAHTRNPVGTVSKLSVSILVADKVLPAEGDQPERTEPRSQEELSALQNMIASALGLDKARGDQIEITSLPFLVAGEDGEAALPAVERFASSFAPFLRYGLLVLAGALLYFVLIRPLMKTLNRDIKAHYKTVEEMEAEQSAAGRGEGPAISPAFQEAAPKDPVQKMLEDVNRNPVFSAHILKNWIHE